MFITHDVLINGGKLVLPDFKTEENGVDKTQKLLIMKEKEKSTVFAQPVDKYLITIPTQYVARFILNRQYHNWEVGVDSTSMADKGMRDGTFLFISRKALRMEGNPLGIDWRLEKQ